MARASLRLGLVLACLATVAQGQTRLGDVPAGGDLRIPLQDIVPLSRLRVEIDGSPVEAGLTLSGRTLVVSSPAGLSGRTHDIVVFRRQPDADIELGIWTFGTPGGEVETSMAGRVELERRLGRDGQQYRFAGNGRLGFDLDEGRLRGGIGFVQTGATRRGLGTEITDYFIETQRAAFGQDLVARLGTQALPAETLLLEDGTWRGASLRLTDPGGRSDVMAFALQPGEASGRRNLTGLADPDARVAGLAGQFFPIAGSSLRADLTAFDGRAELGDGRVGAAAGAGWRLSGPIGADRGDFSLDYAQVKTRADADPASSRAASWAGEMGFGLLPPDTGRSLELRFTAARTGAAFFSPLNPDLIAGESRQGVELLYQADEWQWRLAAERARSNIEDDPDQATDQFHDFGLDVTYSPYVFTGGFLQGVAFYGALASEDQRRVYTPEDGPDPQDFRLKSLSFGMDRFQPDHSWALGAKLDWLEDLSGTGPSERRQRLEASYAFTPDDLTTFTFNAEMGRAEKAGRLLHDVTLEMSYAFPILSENWSGYVEAGRIWVEDDGRKSGRYFGVELKRDLSAGLAVLLRADYGQGTEASSLSPGAGWTFGLALQQDFGAGQP